MIARESLVVNYLQMQFQQLECGCMTSRSTKRLGGGESDQAGDWSEVHTEWSCPTEKSGYTCEFSYLKLVSNHSYLCRWSYLLPSTTVAVHSYFPIFSMKTSPLLSLTVTYFSTVSSIFWPQSWCSWGEGTSIDLSIVASPLLILVF